MGLQHASPILKPVLSVLLSLDSMWETLYKISSVFSVCPNYVAVQYL